MKTTFRLPAICFGTVTTGALVLAACSGTPQTAAPRTHTLSQVGTVGTDGMVVKSRALIQISPNGSAKLLAVQVEPTPSPGASPTTSGTQPIEVTNAASTSMTLDNSGWIVPTVENTVIDFGYLAIATLTDNNLNVCGAAGNEHCGAGLIRTYTTGRDGAGVWNDVDQFGAPLSAALEGTAPTSTVGLNPEGAVVLQSVAIPATQHVLRLSDFIPTPRYDVTADFTNAGAGTYATTLVIEYVLAPTVVTPEPSPTQSLLITPDPTPTISPEPKPTITPDPTPTVTPDPTPTALK